MLRWIRPNLTELNTQSLRNRVHVLISSAAHANKNVFTLVHAFSQLSSIEDGVAGLQRRNDALVTAQQFETFQSLQKELAGVMIPIITWFLPVCHRRQHIEHGQNPSSARVQVRRRGSPDRRRSSACL
jgi:hypothetical protein